MVILAAAAGGVLAFVAQKRRIGTARTEPRSVATATAAGAGVGMVGGDGAEPVDLHGAAVGEQLLELAAGPLDA